MADARVIAEEAARASYGRLLAWLCARTHDVAAAEDALSDAFKAALEHWPHKGIPDSPEAWLLTAARRKLIDESRKHQTHNTKMPALVLAAQEAEATLRDDQSIPDERLKLLFICAHPAIDKAIRTPLMLQTVLGLDAERIASAFLIAPSTMAQRIVRAKRKIKTAGIPFTEPDEHELADRLDAVLEVIYAAYTTGWDAGDGVDARGGDLIREAIFLATLVTELCPDCAEAHGLKALLLHTQARHRARRVDGRYVPLLQQDTDLWDHEMIIKAEHALATAWAYRSSGRFQIEAAIQSAHAAALLHGRETANDIIILYQRLIELAPSIGAMVGYAAALVNGSRPAEALSVLDEITPDRVNRYQSYWAVRAHILADLDQHPKAQEAYQHAIGLAQDSATRDFLQHRLNTLKGL